MSKKLSRKKRKAIKRVEHLMRSKIMPGMAKLFSPFEWSELLDCVNTKDKAR